MSIMQMGTFSTRRGTEPSTPTPVSFLVVTLILTKEDPFLEGRGLGFQCLPRQRWPSSLRRTMWQGGGKKGFSGICLQVSPSLLPQNTMGKAATTITTRPDTQGACWKQNSWSQQPNSMQCELHPLSFARAQLFSGKNPCQGRVGRPKSLPHTGSHGATDAPLPLEAIHFCLSFWDEGQLMMFREEIFQT